MSDESRAGSATAAGVTPGKPPKPAGASAFGPLRSGLFRRLWIANSASNLGFWMQQVAAAWLMTELTRSPSLVALLATAAALPTFLLALPAGALSREC